MQSSQSCIPKKLLEQRQVVYYKQSFVGCKVSHGVTHTPSAFYALLGLLKCLFRGSAQAFRVSPTFCKCSGLRNFVVSIYHRRQILLKTGACQTNAATFMSHRGVAREELQGWKD
jgi:hypothetical protein